MEMERSGFRSYFSSKINRYEWFIRHGAVKKWGERPDVTVGQLGGWRWHLLQYGR